MLVCLSPNICELEHTLIDSTTPFCYQNKTDLDLVSEGILRRFGLRYVTLQRNVLLIEA